MSKITKTPAMVLQELAMQRGFGPPSYEITFSRTGTHENRFDYKVRVGAVEATGIGTSKQISKHEAARNALLKLEEMGIYNPVEMPLQEFKKVPASTSAPDSPVMVAPAPNSIAPLKDLCFENKINDPTFTLISDVGPPHQREFTYECRIDSIRTVATGSTKKMAKQLAAQEMMEKIKDVLPELAQNCPRIPEEKAICDSNVVEEGGVPEFNELFGDIVFDKSVKVDDYPYAIKKLMERFEKTISDFEQDLLEGTMDSLQRILDKLELKYLKYKLRDDPVMMTITLSTDTPFTAMGMADDEESATAQALSSVFRMLNLYTRL